MSIKKPLIIAFLTVLSCTMGRTQTNVISPYSAIGLGDILYDGMLHQSMSGGLIAGFNSSLLSNPANPASLGFLRSTAFEFAATYQYSYLQDGDKNAGIQSGMPDYVSLSFPMRNPVTELLEQKNTDYGWGMGFTLSPYSRVGYDLSSTIYEQDSLLITRNSRASGGTYLFQWSNGLRYKNFSLGISLGYLFGNIKKEREVIPDIQKNPNAAYFTDDIRLKAFKWRIGGLYEWQLNPNEINSKKKKTLSFGTYFSSPQKLNGTVDQFYRTKRLAFSGRDQDLRDTLVLGSNDLEGGKIPLELGIGAYYDDHQHHSFGVDFAYSDWQGFNYDVLNPGGDAALSKGYRIGLGGTYIPSPGDVNFFRRMSYHYGAHYTLDPRLVNGTHLTDIGVSGGITLPAFYIRQVTYIHLGLQAGRAGISDGIMDNYFKVSLGVTFNDNSWFLKRRFN